MVIVNVELMQEASLGAVGRRLKGNEYCRRRTNGAVALRSRLDAGEARRQAEIALASNRLARLENYVTLCQALGGDAHQR